MVQTDRIIVLDPGHGGKDPGAYYNGVRESSITLLVAQKIKSLFNRIQVHLTREEDITVPLNTRVEFANNLNAELFCSLHCNAADTPANGLEIYYCSKVGQQLAEIIWRQLSKIKWVVPHGEPIKKNTSYYVLKHTKMPAVLIEMGFMSNVVDLANLTAPDTTGDLALAIATGLGNALGASLNKGN